MMRNPRAEERNAPRVPMHSSALVYRLHEAKPNLGLIRDVSAHGLFLYSDFTPDMSSHLRVTFCRRLDGEDIQLDCLLRVVRVELVAEGAAVGIGGEIVRFAEIPAQHLRKNLEM
jgi:hypothetical protein